MPHSSRVQSASRALHSRLTAEFWRPLRPTVRRSLWDVSSGPSGLQRLASLITFADGDWAVVATDGRYDASDPADLEGLNWVLPDEPTKPVPLYVFYRGLLRARDCCCDCLKERNFRQSSCQSRIGTERSRKFRSPTSNTPRTVT